MAEKVTVDLRLVAQTPAALGFTEDEPTDPVIWLPRSQIELDDPDTEMGDVVSVELPEWLAIEKGLA